MDEVVIARRFCGPPTSANGGYACGLVAGLLDGRARVTLRSPPPLDRPLQILASHSLPPFGPDIQPYFRDVVDHLNRVAEQITSFDALLDSILQAHLEQVTVAQNEDMRKITAWAAIIAVPTMVCGVYGMNFEHMPELRWTDGYPLALGVMAVACFVLHRSFRRNGWL